ncbi:NAD(P)-dependent oxidoreductase [Flammeovirga agarivorans]|uniref:SDR family oxidoreductase n=1 Tax=Flammeovirga agarivorans TaxID=2726742 RepID=A0A7X8XVW9_9BACT|nr:SDR family oxidoreductase [Flammeovirga agarivorans]NLR91742.1 SDR family oxidoreductase [Flammeovirga agarivorans]
MKKIVVFGSTGTIGKHVISQSLEKGYQVVAFCRNKEKLQELSHPNLIVMEGNVLHSNDVQKAVTGMDVVIVTLGSGKSRTSTVRSEGTKIIIEAMKNQGISRLLCQTTLGAGESNGNLNFFWKHIMFGWFLKKVFLDHELQEEFVKNSHLNWTIIRPSAFTDGNKTGKYLHGFSPTNKNTKLKIARADVADFIIKQINNTAYIHQTPGVSY